MICCHCEKPTIGARVLCNKCMRRLKEDGPHLIGNLQSTTGLNEALALLARVYDRQSLAQHQAYLKGRQRRLTAAAS